MPFLPVLPTPVSALCIVPPDRWAALIEEACFGLHPADVWIQGDEKGLTIEQVRQVQRFASRSPVGPRKLACLTAADAWRAETANALLKLLEEPPEYLQLLLFSESERLLPTVRSRLSLLSVGGQSATINVTERDRWRESLGTLPLEREEGRLAARHALYLFPLLHQGIRQEPIRSALFPDSSL